MAVALHDQLARGGVEARVEPRVLAERERRGPEEGRGQRERDAPGAGGPGAAPERGGGGAPGGGGGGGAGGGAHGVVGPAPAGPAAADGAQVHAELAGQPARRG